MQSARDESKTWPTQDLDVASGATFDFSNMALVSLYRAQETPEPEKILCQGIMSCLGASFSASTSSALPLTIPHTSPEPTNVDTFISGILQAVTEDDLPLCSSCEEGSSASSRCRDCSEMLCDPCVLAHKRVRCTKDHRIVRFSQENISPIPRLTPESNTTTLPETHNMRNSVSSCSQTSISPASSPTATFCDTHHEIHRIYCETCKCSMCAECAVVEHRTHQLMHVQDATEYARSHTMKLSTETRAAIVAVREALDSVQRVYEGIDLRAHQVSAEVRSLIRRYIAGLEERERDLLTRVDHIRQIKGKMIMSQMENLRVALTKLARTSDILNETLDTDNGFDLIVANEKASAELRRIRCIRSELRPCEDDTIVFLPPDNNLLKAVATMGCVTTSGGSFVQQRSRFKEPHMQMLPFIPPIEINGELEFRIRGSGRGRPIFGVANAITAKDVGSTPSSLFGTEGEGDGQLCRPWGVCCDKTGLIVIADRSNNRVQVFKPNGTFSHKFGTQGTGPGEFDRPAGVAIDSYDRIIVADKDNHRVQIFKMDGTFILMFGEKGCRNGQFNYPWDVASNSNGQIVVSDTRNHRIQLFTSEGIFINKYGYEGSSTMWKHFDSPRGVCFTPRGSIIVSDFNNHRIVIIDSNLEQAQYLGSEGTGIKQFFRPQGIICDDDGRIIVADSRNNRIQVFESNGNFLWKIGQAGRGPGELDRPSGICLSPDGRIVVVDFGNNRVQIF